MKLCILLLAVLVAVTPEWLTDLRLLEFQFTGIALSQPGETTMTVAEIARIAHLVHTPEDFEQALIVLPKGERRERARQTLWTFLTWNQPTCNDCNTHN